VPKCVFGWGSAPDPAGRAYSAPPDPLAGFKGPTSKGRGRQGTGEERRGKGRRSERKGAEGEKGEGKEGEGKGKDHTGSSFSPLRALQQTTPLL